MIDAAEEGEQPGSPYMLTFMEESDRGFLAEEDLGPVGPEDPFLFENSIEDLLLDLNRHN